MYISISVSILSAYNDASLHILKYVVCFCIQMGFLRQKEDGSTSLAILTPSNGVLPGTREQPISLGTLTGKLSQGTTQLQGYREDKKNHIRSSRWSIAFRILYKTK